MHTLTTSFYLKKKKKKEIEEKKRQYDRLTDNVEDTWKKRRQWFEGRS